MANTNGAFGLKPISKFGQGTNSTGNGGYTFYEIASGNTNKIYQGALVIPLNTGFIDAVGAAAGGTVSVLGVFGGCEYVSSVTGKLTFSNYWPGTGADSNFPVKARVYDDPMQMFIISSAGATIGADDALTEANYFATRFANADPATATTGSDTTGLSAMTLDLTTVAATAAHMFRIVGIQEDVENSDFTATGIPMIVRLNNHFNAPNGSIAAGTVSSLGLTAID
jgi:hypothetical protein